MWTEKLFRIALMTVLVMLLLASCSTSPSIGAPTLVQIPPTRAASSTPTPDTTAQAEATEQAQRILNMTQNASHLATGAAMMTASSEARPPTTTPTNPPTSMPTAVIEGVMVHDVLVHYADVQTGLEEVDQIVEVVLAGDIFALKQMVNFTVAGCTHEMALGGPPKCREGEAEGTLVEVLPFMGPEGHFLRKVEFSGWQGMDVAGLYAVYRVSDEVYSHKIYPAGEYAIVFRSKDPTDLITLQVANGYIRRVDYTFGTPPEIDFDRDAQEIILSPPNTNSGCPGAPPTRLVIGAMASVCTQSEDLIMRFSPGMISQALIGVQPGTNLMIIDGPSCANNWFWWKVELDTGLAGWVAEGGDDVDPYFICPK